MNGGSMTILSNSMGRMTNYTGNKDYNRAVDTGSAIITFYVRGKIITRFPSEKSISGNSITRGSSYNIQHIHLNQRKDMPGSSMNKLIDLMKLENLDKIKKMEMFGDDWNGTGGSAFSKGAIDFFVTIIETLNKQPGIAPTGRNSLLMQYELDDKSLLAFEVSEGKAEKVYIPEGDYSKAQLEVFTENVAYKIKECVEKIYGFKQYCG